MAVDPLNISHANGAGCFKLLDMCNVKGCLNNTVAKGHARKR
jgi:hypothetical protein